MDDWAAQGAIKALRKARWAQSLLRDCAEEGGQAVEGGARVMGAPPLEYSHRSRSVSHLSRLQDACSVMWWQDVWLDDGARRDRLFYPPHPPPPTHTFPGSCSTVME